MYFFLILFFFSLAVITIMIVRKLSLLSNIEGHHHNSYLGEILILDMLDFDKLKKLTIKNGKKMGHTTIWVTLRIYLISSNFVNKKRKEIVVKVKNRLNRNRHNSITEEKKEVSKYIKMISEYRQKIRKIKHKIKEEEGIE